MAITNVLLLSQIAGYSIGLILSLCIVVPMSLHQAEFDGYCILFSQGMWIKKTNQMHVSWASAVYCHYVLFVGLVIMIVCCVQIYRLLALWSEQRDSTFLSAFLEATGCLMLAAMALSSGIILTFGFMTWCQSVSKWFPSCQDIAGEAIEDVNETTEWFYVEMDTAQVATWAAFTTLVGLTVASTLKFLRYHDTQNMYAVMYAERAGETRPLTNSGRPVDGRVIYSSVDDRETN